jgi:ribonuclease P protein component
MKYAENPKRKSYRLAVVVSKKVHKSAVVRNRIRRRVYEIFRREETKFITPQDIVVTIFSEQTAKVSHEELVQQTKSQLRQIGIL